MSTILSKTPQDRLDYDVEFHRWLSDGDTVVGAIATISGTSAAIDGVETAERTVKVWVIGGTIGDTYQITVTADTQAGRTKKVCFSLRIKGRN